MSTDTELDMRGISRCWQNRGWHVYGAGPCFDTHEQAIQYREAHDKAWAAEEKYRKEKPWSHGISMEWWTFNRMWAQ